MEQFSEKEFLLSFGKNLRKMRKLRGFTQEQLANEIGVEISQISRIERGVINTSVYNTYHIAKILDIEVAELFAR